jgi:hypothetical protein
MILVSRKGYFFNDRNCMDMLCMNRNYQYYKEEGCKV